MSDSRIKKLASPVGDLFVVADRRGVLLCEFDTDGRCERQLESFGVSPAESDDAVVDQVRDELAEYFKGDRREFTVPLAPLGTPFQQAVWRQLLAIPFGQTRTYGQQAVAVGNRLAIRAVARANGSNCRGILIPCHRVIGSNGSLTGFGGGLPRKQWLLDHERAVAGEGGLFAAPLQGANASG
ncbi:MAG: methylated-DNA--[protein]-cysteine S-methyltransferase [Tepidisphaeraceae bacterium]